MTAALIDWRARHASWRTERHRLEVLDRTGRRLDELGCRWFSVDGVRDGETEFVVGAPPDAAGGPWHRPCAFRTPLFELGVPPGPLVELLTVQSALAVQLVRRYAEADRIPEWVVAHELLRGYRALVPARAARIDVLRAHVRWLERTMIRQGRSIPDESGVVAGDGKADGSDDGLHRAIADLGARLVGPSREPAVVHELVARLMHLQVTRLWGPDAATVLSKERRCVDALRVSEEAALPAAHDG